MSKANRECYTCSKKYYYCPNCPSDIKKESFYNMFCCERCSKIFKTLTNETFKHITTEQCKEELINLGVNSNETLKDGIKKHIERVMNYKTSDLNKEPIMEEIENTEDIHTDEIVTVKPQTEDKNIVNKIKYTPKKSRKTKK